MNVDKLASEITYTSDVNGQIQKAKDALRLLENSAGKQAWITMVIAILDFQQTKLSRPGIAFKAFDNALKSFQKAGGM